MPSNPQTISRGLSLVAIAVAGVLGVTSYQLNNKVNELYEEVELSHAVQDYLYIRQEVLEFKTEVIIDEVIKMQRNLTPVQTDQKMEFEPLDHFCMAKNIFHEARGENEIGQYAVAQVTINRVKHTRYPNTVCDVVMQSWQFSWANRHANRWSHPSGREWERAKQIATDVLSNGYRIPALDTALFYHADYVTPSWKLPEAKIAQIGTHIFYTEDRKL